MNSGKTGTLDHLHSMIAQPLVIYLLERANGVNKTKKEKKKGGV